MVVIVPVVFLIVFLADCAKLSNLEDKNDNINDNNNNNN